MKAAGIPIPALMVAAEDVSVGKPAPDCFLLGAKRLGVDARDCLVFEDAPAGIAAAEAAGAAVMVISATHQHRGGDPACDDRRLRRGRIAVDDSGWMTLEGRRRSAAEHALEVAGQAFDLPVAVAAGFLAAAAADFLRQRGFLFAIFLTARLGFRQRAAGRRRQRLLRCVATRAASVLLGWSVMRYFRRIETKGLAFPII